MGRVSPEFSRTLVAGLMAVAVLTPDLALGQAPGPDRDHPSGSMGACDDDPRFHEFDFWIGEWELDNRWRPRDGSGDWVVAGSATNNVYPVVQGCGIVEHWRGNLGPNFILGFSLRAFNPDTEKWELVLLWPQPDRPNFGTLEGEFTHGRGEFFFESRNQDGDPVLNRYSFSDITHDKFRWDQAWSTDGGFTWASNWIMEFRRRLEMSAPVLNGPAMKLDRCTFDEMRQMDGWVGDWRGVAMPGGGTDTVPARALSYHILGGCGLMDFLEIGQGEDRITVYRVRTYEPASEAWVEYSLDSRLRRIERLEGQVDGNTARLESPEERAGRLLRSTWSSVGEGGRAAFTVESSRDGGGSWMTLWTVELQRRGAPAG